MLATYFQMVQKKVHVCERVSTNVTVLMVSPGDGCMGVYLLGLQFFCTFEIS